MDLFSLSLDFGPLFFKKGPNDFFSFTPWLPFGPFSTFLGLWSTLFYKRSKSFLPLSSSYTFWTFLLFSWTLVHSFLKKVQKFSFPLHLGYLLDLFTLFLDFGPLFFIKGPKGNCSIHSFTRQG